LITVAEDPTLGCTGSFRPALRLAGRQSSRSVAALALPWRGFIEEDILAANFARLFVTPFAAHIPMQSLQGKRGTLVMVEQGRLPLRAIVAIDARGDFVLCELHAMNVLVTVFAFGRSHCEIRCDQLRFHVWRFVAVDAGSRLMCSD